MKTRKFLIFAALLPLLLLLAGCGEKQAFKPIVFVAGHSADSLTNAAGNVCRATRSLARQRCHDYGDRGIVLTNLSYCFEIPRTTSLTLHSQYNPVIESASTKFLLHSDAVECQLDATYAEDGELTFEIDAESCRLRGGRHGVQSHVRLRLRGQDDADDKGGRFAGGRGHIPERKRRHPVGHGVYAPPVCTRQRRDGAVL